MDLKQTITDALYFRHACKEFDASKKIDDADFDLILEAGRLSPCSFGIEPWQFMVVQNMDKRDILKEHTWGAQGQLPTASHFVVILCRRSFFMSHESPWVPEFMTTVQGWEGEGLKARQDRYTKFHVEDFDLAGNDRATFAWSTRQTYIALANMMNTAALLGVDSCPIEGFCPEILDKTLATHFGIDTEKWGVSVMAGFGYRKNPAQKKTRQTIDQVVRWVK